VQQTVEAAEFVLDHCRQFVVLVRQGGFQVERNDCRLRVTSLFDFVVEVVEAFFGLAQQQHRRTVGSERLGGSGTDATAGAGDQNDPAFKQVGAGNVVKHAGQSSGNGGGQCVAGGHHK